MGYFDFAVGVSLFLSFFALVLILSSNYFSNLSGLTKTSEFTPVAESIFKISFKRKGVPEDWGKASTTPVEIGLAEDLYKVGILVVENNGSSRVTEPVTVNITFDENCQNKSWNTTIRLYDEDYRELKFEKSNTTSCSSQYLKNSNITFEVNISANQAKRYWLYYSPESGITDPNYTPLSYNTSSWIPSDGDNWTENTVDWSRYGGYSGTVTNDTINKIMGNRSVNITDAFSGDSLGLQYNPTQNITGASNDWYLDAWLYLDNTSQLSYFYVNVSDSNGTSNFIYTNILSSVTGGVWHHFVKPLDSSQWNQSGNFNASGGVDRITFYLTNTTPGLTRTLKVDGLHFKKKPLDVKAFPEEQINAISFSKFNALRNISYEESKKTMGENYNFRIEVVGIAYGGNINASANVGCHESSAILQSTNGTISNTMVRMCVWK